MTRPAAAAVAVVSLGIAEPGAADRLSAATAALFPPTREDAPRVGLVNVNVHRRLSDPDQPVPYENWRRADFVAYNGHAAPVGSSAAR